MATNTFKTISAYKKPTKKSSQTKTSSKKEQQYNRELSENQSQGIEILASEAQFDEEQIP